MGSGSRQIFYESPCGIRLEDYEQLLAYLQKTKSLLSVDHFIFEPWVSVWDEFKATAEGLVLKVFFLLLYYEERRGDQLLFTCSFIYLYAYNSLSWVFPFFHWNRHYYRPLKMFSTVLVEHQDISYIRRKKTLFQKSLNLFQLCCFFVILQDLSYGKEFNPIPVVNTVDRDLPPYLNYMVLRKATDGVPLNLDTDFLICCDCTDDCSVSTFSKYIIELLCLKKQ